MRFLALLLLILFSTLILPRTIQEYNLSKSQESVMVTVKLLPNCSSGYRNKFIHISYEGRTYIIRTKCKFVQGLAKGQLIAMLHKPGTDLFLFPNENTTSELVITCLLVVLFGFGTVGFNRKFGS